MTDQSLSNQTLSTNSPPHGSPARTMSEGFGVSDLLAKCMDSNSNNNNKCGRYKHAHPHLSQIVTNEEDFKTHLSLPPHPDGTPAMILVLKVGTSTLMETRKHRFSLSNLGKFVDVVCDLKEKGYYVVLVSSGAVGAGCIHLKMEARPSSLVAKQAVSAVGQSRLIRLYEDIFAIREQKVAQLLLTRTDLMDRTKFMNFRNTLISLLSMNVVPIINENDSLATEGLKFGDNDTLAAYVAVSIGAHWLFLLTDVDCLYTSNPRLHSDARPIPYVGNVGAAYNLMQDDENAGTSWGTGGMKTKVIAAKLCVATGIHTALCHGEYPERIMDIIHFAEGGKDDDTIPESQEEGGNLSNVTTATKSNAEAEYPLRRISKVGVQKLYAKYSAARIDSSSEAGPTPAGPVDGTLGQQKSRESPILERMGSEMSHEPEGPSVFEAAVNRKTGAVNIQKIPSKEGLLSQAEKVGRDSHSMGESLVKLASRDDLSSEDLPKSESTSHIPQDEHQEKVSIVTFPNLSEMPYLGTIFAAQECTQSIRDQRRWILSLPVRGSIYIDKGCARAVIEDKKSLFAAGIVAIKGIFDPGDAVAIYYAKTKPGQGATTADEEEAMELARALVNYSSTELDQIKGLKTSEFHNVLGGGDLAQEAAHRSNIIFVDPTPIYEMFPVAAKQENSTIEAAGIPMFSPIPIPQLKGKPQTKSRSHRNRSSSSAGR